MKGKLLLAPLIGFLLLLVACPKDQYTRAANASKDFEGATKAFQDIVVAARHANPPLLDAQEDIELETIIKRMAQVNDRFAAGILKASQGQSAASDIDAAISLAQELDTYKLDFVKNQQKRAELQLALTLARGAVTTVRLILGK